MEINLSEEVVQTVIESLEVNRKKVLSQMKRYVTAETCKRKYNAAKARRDRVDDALGIFKELKK